MRQTSGVPRPEFESRFAREQRLWPHAPHVEPLSFRRAPLLAAAIAFALGESFTKIPHTALRPTLLLCVGTCALALFAVLALRRSPRIAVCAALSVWLSVGLWSAQIEPAPPPQTALLGYADGLSRTVEARVIRIHPLPARDDAASDSDPDQWNQTGAAATALDLDVTSIEDVTPDTSRMVSIAGGVRATLYAERDTQTPTLHCGDHVELPLRLREPERYRDPGVWQYADYLLDQHIAATATAPAIKLRVVAQPSGIGTPLRCRIYAAQSWASGRLLAFVRSNPNRSLPAALRLTPEDAGMLNAMLFGDRTSLTHTLRTGFERTGSFHLFVVSGMHVALLAGLLFWLARRLHLRPWFATLLTLALVSAYALITGFGVPVQRALLMIAVFLAARLLSRQRNTLNALGAAALAVLIGAPHALFEASFQMTFLAIVAIAGIAVPLGERSFLPYARAARHLRRRWIDNTLPPRLAQFRMMVRLWCETFADAFGERTRFMPAAFLRTVVVVGELILVSVVVESVMVLPMAFYFHRITAFALPANIVSVPLVAVLVPLGLGTFLASLFGTHAAALPASVLALLLHGITGLIHRISNTPSADLRIPGPTIAHAMLALVCLAICCWAVRRGRALAWAALVLLPLTAAIALWPVAPAVIPDRLEVAAIDVGQGDSLLVVGPSGRTMLIDAGGPTGAAANAENATLNTDSGFDIGEEVVSPYLWSRQLRRLDVVALTHAHSDHMGGMPAVLRNFRPRELWVGVDPDSAPYRALLAEATTLGIRIRHLRAGDHVAWGGMALSVLAPAPDYVNPGAPVNDDSLVMRLQYGHASALLEGDAEAPSEDAMAAAARNGTGPAVGPDTLLKVGHHGSRTSTTAGFLSLVAPQDAVISVGRNNTFGHPNREVIARLAADHVRLYRTDQSGLSSFLLTPDGRISVPSSASNP